MDGGQKKEWRKKKNEREISWGECPLHYAHLFASLGFSYTSGFFFLIDFFCCSCRLVTISGGAAKMMHKQDSSASPWLAGQGTITTNFSQPRTPTATTKVRHVRPRRRCALCHVTISHIVEWGEKCEWRYLNLTLKTKYAPPSPPFPIGSSPHHVMRRKKAREPSFRRSQLH